VTPCHRELPKIGGTTKYGRGHDGPPQDGLPWEGDSGRDKVGQHLFSTLRYVAKGVPPLLSRM
jgi:hypothetical protein